MSLEGSSIIIRVFS